MEVTYGMVKKANIARYPNQDKRNKPCILKKKCYSVGKKERFPDAFFCSNFLLIPAQIHCRGPPDFLLI